MSIPPKCLCFWCFLNICRPEFLPPMTSRWEWSSKPMTPEIPPQSVSPRWWVWPESVCVYVWTGATTATTSGGWWTRLTFSPLAPVRRTETCYNRRWVRKSEEGGGRGRKSLLQSLLLNLTHVNSKAASFYTQPLGFTDNNTEVFWINR